MNKRRPPPPPMTAEAWMLVRALKAAQQPRPFANRDLVSVIDYLHFRYGREQLYQAIDCVNKEYRREP